MFGQCEQKQMLKEGVNRYHGEECAILFLFVYRQQVIDFRVYDVWNCMHVKPDSLVYS